jgi:predicted ATPase
MTRTVDQNRFFGREEAMARLDAWHARGGALLTLVGPGGIGKTRLARRFARRKLAAHEAERVLFCDLSESRSADGVISVIAQALELPPGAPDPGAQLAAAIGARRDTLLILDNFEHVVAAGSGVVAGWLDAGLDVRVLVTSREPLGLPDEERLELGPLGDEEALRLLEDRVQTARAGEPLPAGEREVARELVRRLDGIPLALELCASRAELLSLVEIRARLERHFDLLRDERAAAGARHATLRVAIGWSWELLSPAEQRGLSQCSVFRGGFSIDAAEAVLDLGRDAPAAIEIVQALRRKSLLHGGAGRGAGGRSRVGIYEAIRLFAADQLDASARGGAMARHAAHLVAEAAKLDAAPGPDEERALAQLADERDNLAGALAWSLEHDARTATTLALALDRLHAERGPWSARRALLDAAVGAAERAGDAALRARALERRGAAAIARGDLVAAAVDLGDALALARASGARATEAAALCALTHVHWRRFEREAALARGEEALAVATATGDRALTAAALRELGDVYRVLGRGEDAERALSAALAIHRELEARREEAADLLRLAALFGNTRRLHRARDVLLLAHAIHGELGNPAHEARSLRMLALATYELGELDVATELADGALALARQTGDRSAEVAVLRIFATLLLELDREDEALASVRAAQALGAQLGSARADGDLLQSTACAHLLGGRDAAAEATLDEALVVARRAADAEGEGQVLGWRAVVLAARGCHDEARGALADARARLEGVLDRAYLSVIDVLEGVLDEDGGAARLARFEARGPLDSSTVRVAMRIVAARRARPPSAPAEPEGRVEIEATGRWFRAPGATRVSLSRRPSLRAVLDALLRRRNEAPGQGTPWEALLAAGWPGERVQRRAAKNRVQVAVRTLRREGLEPVLLTVDEGYQLDPARTRPVG